MWECLENAIETEAKKRLAKLGSTASRAKPFGSARRDAAAPQPLDTSDPLRSWQEDRQFDPFYCLGHARLLAKGIWRSLSTATYRPHPTFRFRKAKTDGGLRTIDLFSIPDAAVASIFLGKIQRRNHVLLSDDSYAYQPGKSSLQAVERLKTIFGVPGWYVGSYDLKNFFDTIDHAALLGTIGTYFRVTAIESAFIQAVIAHEWATTDGAHGVRAAGIPQGLSLSVTLSNFALHRLDLTVGRNCDHYFRYADDILLINKSAEKALACQGAFRAFVAAHGFSVCQTKSAEVQLAEDPASDPSDDGSFDYLGYRFSKTGVMLPDQVLGQIKRSCAKIIYDNMIVHIRRMPQTKILQRTAEEDLASALRDLTRYIYGGNTDQDLRAYLNGGRVTIRDTGVMAYYCLLENADALRALDGWLVDCLRRACRFRAKLTTGDHPSKRPVLTRRRLVSGDGTQELPVSRTSGCPSFYLVWRALRKRHFRTGFKT